MSALEKPIEKYPYRVLASFSFDCTQTPLRSARVIGDGPQTEVVVSSNDRTDNTTKEHDYDICQFPDHRKFVDSVRIAEKEAKETGVRVPYLWRGYRGFVAPSLPPITVQELEVRLINALRRIPTLSVPETMVRHKKKYFIFAVCT